jgi:hypothetical protein
MAKMHPENAAGLGRATAHERRVFRFLKEAARPHEDYVCWYGPAVAGTEEFAGFILFGKGMGLVVIKVTDWAPHQIISATPFRFTIQIAGKEKKQPNPDKEVKAAVDSLTNRLMDIPELVYRSQNQQGGLQIPIGRMVVFPGIPRQTYFERGFQWLIPPERVWFRNDLQTESGLLSDPSGTRFRERILAALPFPFKGPALDVVNLVDGVLRPHVAIKLPERPGAGRARFQREMANLDEAQERLALRLGKGHQLIKGPPGSGKTVALVHRCCYVHRFHPGMRSLLVCYNIALVSYLKQMIQERGVAVGAGGTEVCHFFDLCARILGKEVHFENQPAEYYDRVIRDALHQMRSGRSAVGPYDAVFIDEGQDFSDPMLKLVMGLLKSNGDLVICLDVFQDLYSRKRSWRSLGIQASGRTHYLKQVYRHTAEIFRFTQCFLGEPSAAPSQLAVHPEDPHQRGIAPELRPFDSPEGVEEFLIEDIQGSLATEGYKRSEIAVIYDDKVYGPDRFAYDNRALPMRMVRALEAAGIPAIWISQDARSKEAFDVTRDCISLISIHSSKGLDFDLAYLVGVDRIQSAPETQEGLRLLLYVAMTRARYRLVVPYVETTGFIRRMRDCLPG